MSSGPNPNPLSSRIPEEFTPARGMHGIQTARHGRGVQPSYANGLVNIASLEPITISINTPAITAGNSATVTGSVGLQQATSVTLQPYDTGNIIFTNVSVAPPANIMPGHPTLQVTSNQGNPVVGQLASGQSYNGIGLEATLTIFATANALAGLLTVTASVGVLGGVLGD